MNIDEAIKLLGSLQGETPEQLATPMQQAIKLGIKALERVKEQRNPDGCITDRLLPGETEE
jgi:hypothetical protein